VPSTRTALSGVAKALDNDKVTSKTLVVLHRDEDLAWISLRNVAALHVITVDQLNAYDVLVNDDVVFTSAALTAYVAGPTKGRASKATATESEDTSAEPVEAPDSTSAEPVEAPDSTSAEPVEAPEDALRQAQGTEAQGTEAQGTEAQGTEAQGTEGEELR